MKELEDRWLSVEEICKYLGISNDTVYRWIDKRKMPASKVGRLWKFKRSEVDEWVKSGGGGPKRNDELYLFRLTSEQFSQNNCSIK